MYRFNIAIRWPNGDVEGFSGFGFDVQAAERKAYQEADAKALFIKKHYEVLTKAMVNAEELFQIREDWSTYN